tara:strand:+ start:348 stop:647 length:300 start_codon:yes stop_codon:yes gene_type:complete
MKGKRNIDNNNIIKKIIFKLRLIKLDISEGCKCIYPKITFKFCNKAIVNHGDIAEKINNNIPVFLKYSIFFELGAAIKLNNKRYSSLSLTAKAKNTTEM